MIWVDGTLYTMQQPFFIAYRDEDNDGVAEKRAVRLGAQSLARVEVLEGLQPGDRVVVSGTELFRGAERVAVNP